MREVISTLVHFLEVYRPGKYRPQLTEVGADSSDLPENFPVTAKMASEARNEEDSDPVPKDRESGGIRGNSDSPCATKREPCTGTNGLGTGVGDRADPRLAK